VILGTKNWTRVGMDADLHAENLWYWAWIWWRRCKDSHVWIKILAEQGSTKHNTKRMRRVCW